MHRRTLALAAGTLMLAVPGARADTVITDFLDRIGGCRKPMRDSFSYEISPYTAKPYGKALADWTDQDVAAFRAYFVACQARRPDWRNVGDYNRNEAIRVIDTSVAELTYKVGQARAETGASAEQVQADSAVRGERDRRELDARRKVAALTQEVVRFIDEDAKTLPADQLVVRIDGYLDRMRALAPEVAGTPAAAGLSAMLAQLEQGRGGIVTVQDRDTAAAQRVKALLGELHAANAYQDLTPPERFAKLDDFLRRYEALGSEVAGTRVAKIYERTLADIREQRASAALQAGRDPATAPGAADGPYTDFEWMGQRGIMAVTNPLQREEFRASLARGIDFNVGVSAIERFASGWLVQLSGRPGVAGRSGQGFFCRVDGSDTASLAVLRGITPPYGIIHAAAPGADEFILQTEPLFIRIVFGPCRISAPDNGSPRRGGVVTPGATAPGPQGPGNASRSEPVAPSPANLRCQTYPPRREHERVMARRLRQAWAIPVALRDDPTLWLTFAVTLNFDAELTGPVELQRSGSQRATPEQLRAAIEAGRQAILASAPFSELGQFAGGTMQVDMTPCD